MKILFTLLLFYLPLTLMGQNDNTKSTTKTFDNFYIGVCGPCLSLIPPLKYPLISDIVLNKYRKLDTNIHVSYPLLIVNNIIIRDSCMVNDFRNNYEMGKITFKSMTKKEASKKGIKNVPKDGILFVTTKKGYYFEFKDE